MVKNKICFVAGRSGGHIIPAITLAQKEKKENQSIKILFFSVDSNLDKKITNFTKIIDFNVRLKLENVPYKKFYRYPIFFWNLLITFFKCFQNLRVKKPIKVISTGGYISIPVCLSAKLLRIPIELFELNVIPGKSIKFLSPLAKKINICFDETINFLPKKKCFLTPYPQRFDKKSYSSSKTIKKNKIDNKKTILVLGGSQGSIFLNKLIGIWIEKNTDVHKDIRIIHQTGTSDKTDWNNFYKKNNIPAIVFDFCNHIEKYYELAEIIVCRSGAGSLFETLFFKKQCITIPLETKNDRHQLYNAQSIQKKYPNYFTLIQQKDLTTDQKIFFDTINSFISV